MKKEFVELEMMIKSINQDNNRPRTSNPTITQKNKKEGTETQRTHEVSNDIFRKQLSSNSKYKDIFDLMSSTNVQTETTKRSNKAYSQYNGMPSTKRKHQTKTQKKFSSIINEIFPESTNIDNAYRSSNKAKCELNLHHQMKVSIQPKNHNITYNIITHSLDKKMNTKPSIALRYTSCITSNEQFNNKKNLSQYQRFPVSNWFIKQQEKYKNVFYLEKVSNIRNLVSIIDNKEHRITNNFYGNNNKRNQTDMNAVASVMTITRNQTKQKSSAYNATIDNFSNRLFQKEPLMRQPNYPRKYSITSQQLTSSNTPSFQKDSLITNYNKILQRKVSIKILNPY